MDRNHSQGRRPLTQAELAARRAEAERRRFIAEKRREEKRKKLRQRIITAVFLTTTTVTLVIGVGMLVFWNSFISSDADSNKSVIYRYGGEDSSEVVSYGRAFTNGTLYVNFTRTAEMLNISAVGTATKIRYVIRSVPPADGSEGTGKEEYAVLEADSNCVVINGVTVRMDLPVERRDGNIWVPVDFITNHMKGVSVVYTQNDGVVMISHTVDESSTKDNIVYKAVAFSEKPTNAPALVSEDAVTVPKPTFAADLTAYEEYMNPAEYGEYLVLANKSTTLDASYVPPDLTNVADTRRDGRDTQQLRYYAAKALEALFIEMRAENMADYNASSGQSVSVMSGYRSYAYQEYLFSSYIAQEKAAVNNGKPISDAEARAIVLTYSALPGTSEHQTGLCVDMHNLPSASTAYKSQASYEWLCENAWKFGFILRYPEDKTALTGYDFEPWHWRYVGREAAYTIHEGGMCLEEYLEGIKK